MLREQVDHLRVASVDGALQRRHAVRPGAGIGAGVEQQAHVLHPAGADSPIQREVQPGGLELELATAVAQPVPFLVSFVVRP